MTDPQLIIWHRHSVVPNYSQSLSCRLFLWVEHCCWVWSIWAATWVSSILFVSILICTGAAAVGSSPTKLGEAIIDAENPSHLGIQFPISFFPDYPQAWNPGYETTIRATFITRKRLRPPSVVHHLLLVHRDHRHHHHWPRLQHLALPSLLRL